MIRRLLLIGLFAYVAISVSRAANKRAGDVQRDENAEANWDSEGGTPAPDPVDTPVTLHTPHVAAS